MYILYVYIHYYSAPAYLKKSVSYANFFKLPPIELFNIFEAFFFLAFLKNKTQISKIKQLNVKYLHTSF